jgi:hypothetical protein
VRIRRWSVVLVILVAFGLALVPATTGAQVAPARTAAPLRFLGEFVYPGGTTFEGTAVGELSGIVYDARRGVYYAVADDRSVARFYTLRVDAGPGGIAGVRVEGVTLLDSDAATPGIQRSEPGDTDLEDIVLLPNGDLIISSERDRNNAPWLRRFAPDGRLLAELPIPEKFRPAPDRGTRSNLAFEAIGLSPDGNTLFVANEQALVQDGPLATPDAGTTVRLLQYDLRGAPRPGSEAVYRTEPIFARPDPAGAAADNGVTAVLPARHLLPRFDLLVMERSFVTGTGNDVSIFGVTLAGAEDVAGLAALPAPFTGRTVAKTLLVNMRGAGINPDNLEAMAFGPRLPNGRPSLLVVSDDNLSATQRNQFLLFEIDAAVGLPRTGLGAGADPTGSHGPTPTSQFALFALLGLAAAAAWVARRRAPARLGRLRNGR